MISLIVNRGCCNKNYFNPTDLGPNIKSKSSIPMVIQFRQGLLSMRTLALDGQLILPGTARVNIALDLLAQCARPQPVSTTHNLGGVRGRLHHNLEGTLLDQPPRPCHVQQVGARPRYRKGFIITWILHQIIVYS